MGADGTLGGQIETEETTNKLRGLVGGGGRADGSRGNHQRVARTRWWWWKDRWKLGNRPTSRCDSLVVVEGRWRPRKPPTSRHDSLVVVEGRWRSRRPPTSHRDSLVVAEGRWRQAGLNFLQDVGETEVVGKLENEKHQLPDP